MKSCRQVISNSVLGLEGRGMLPSAERIWCGKNKGQFSDGLMHYGVPILCVLQVVHRLYFEGWPSFNLYTCK